MFEERTAATVALFVRLEQQAARPFHTGCFNALVSIGNFCKRFPVAAKFAWRGPEPSASASVMISP
jgi:hypothetical protein